MTNEDYLKVPPSAPEAEQSILGSLMLDGRLTDDVLPNLRSVDFYRNDHQIIYNAICKLIADGVTADVVTVSEYLISTSELDTIGGLSYLGSLAKNTPHTANVEAYVNIVKEKSTYRRLIEGANDIIQSAYQPDGKSPEDVLQFAEGVVNNVLQGSTSLDAKHISFYLGQATDDLETRWKSGGQMVGTPTGFDGLDKLMLGMEGGEVYVVAARPGMGKTAFAMNMAKHIGTNGGHSLFISLEMPIKQLINRLWSSYGIDHGAIRSGKLENDDWTNLTHSVGELTRSGIYVDETSSLSVGQISAIVKKRVRLSGKMPIFIDYLQIMGSEGKTNNRYEEVTKFSMGLKALAKSVDCPIILLSQLNRGLESRSDKRPVMSDLRESGAIEQDATGIIFLYRDVVYNKGSAMADYAECILAKQRNGECGTVPLGWEGKYQRFTNLTGDQEYRFYQAMNAKDESPMKKRALK